MVTLKVIRDFDYKIGVDFDEKIYVSESSIPKTIAANDIPDDLPDSLKQFYLVVTRFYYKWETIDLMDNDGLKLKGRINILPAETVVRDWEGTTYFKDDEVDEDDEEIEMLKKFKIVDYFVNEACTGYIQDEENSDRMYYLTLGENELQDMGVSFEGYIELMLAARGFWYWQTAILDLKRNDGDYQYEAKEFKTYMPQIFPDFKWEEFVALYERVKLK